MTTYDPRLGQDFTMERAGNRFSSLDQNFFVLDGIWEPGNNALDFLNECMVKTSKLGFFVVTPWVPGASRLVKRIAQDFSIASEVEGSVCGYFDVNPGSVEKLFLLREESNGARSGEWGIGGCMERFDPPARHALFRGETWDLFHIMAQATKLGCLHYYGEMHQASLLTRLFDGFDSAVKKVAADVPSVAS